jgi:hypothetical protein
MVVAKKSTKNKKKKVMHSKQKKTKIQLKKKKTKKISLDTCPSCNKKKPAFLIISHGDYTLRDNYKFTIPVGKTVILLGKQDTTLYLSHLMEMYKYFGVQWYIELLLNHDFARESGNVFRHREIYSPGDEMVNLEIHADADDIAWGPFGDFNLPLKFSKTNKMVPSNGKTHIMNTNVRDYIKDAPRGVYFIFCCRTSTAGIKKQMTASYQKKMEARVKKDMMEIELAGVDIQT